MKKVEFLHTSAGTYGIAHAGDKLTLQDSLANQLEKSGVVKVTGEAGKDAEESTAKNGSFRIHDETTKEKVTKLAVEDPHDPTNEAKNKEKNEKAGPNAPKKK
jgi:hypothetical protein